MRRILRSWPRALVALLILRAPIEASAAPIDDFEFGTFVCGPSGVCSPTVNVNLPIGVHTMTRLRRVSLAAAGGSAALTPAAGRDDGVQLVFEQPNTFELLMLPGQVGITDITDYGTSDRFYLRFDEVVGAFTVSLASIFLDGEVVAPDIFVSSPGTYAVPFSWFGESSDKFNGAYRMRLRISGANGAACLSDWRTGRPAFEPVRWTEDTHSAQGFAPFAPIEWIGNEGGSLVSSSSLTVADVFADERPLLVAISGSVQNLCGTGPTTQAALAVTMLDDGFEKVTVRLRMQPRALPSSSLVFDGPASLVEGAATAAVEVPLRRFHASGALEGVLRQTLRLDVGNTDTMVLVLESVQLGLVGAPTSYEVVLRVIASGPIPVDALLFSLSLEEALATMGGPATGVAAGSADPTPGLSARPSTFRESTRFDLAEPVARNESLRVYDVRGRLVRRLTVPAGTRGVTWNGRDDAGERVGSGVYFAHLEAREPMTAKVTTVR